MTKQLKQHKQKYWYIPKFAILPIIATLFFGFLAYMNLKLINWNIIKTAFDCTKDNCNLVPKDLIVCYPIIAEYIFIALTLISFIAIIKSGFDNLKSYKDDGLIMDLIVGLIVGLIWGLIWGLIVGLIWGLIWGLIGGLIGSLFLGLIGGLIGGLIWGLTKEFRDD